MSLMMDEDKTLRERKKQYGQLLCWASFIQSLPRA